MRTFAHFPTDNREHRLLGFGAETPEPREIADAPPPAEAFTPIEMPEVVVSEATKIVEAADTDIAKVDVQLETVEPSDAAMQPEVADAQANLDAIANGVDPRGTAYPELASTPGYDEDGFMATSELPKTRSEIADATTGETVPVSIAEQAQAIDGFSDTGTDGTAKEMNDVRATLEDRVLNRFAKSFPGVLIDTYDMPNEYVINGNDPVVMEKIRQQAEAHGLSPKDNGDGTMTVTITGFEKGVGYTGPGNSPKEATQPSEVSLEESSARDIENSKKENPDVDMKDLLKPVQRDSLIGGKPYKRPVTKEDLDKAIKKDEEKNDVSKKIENPQRNPSLEIAADPNSNEGAPESKEVLTENYEREKIEQRESREDEKLSDVSSGNRDQWSTIDNGKTDGTGKPFLYKEGTRTIDGQEQRVLLAYSPNGGVQVMDINTHEWKFMNQMTPDEQKQIGGAEGMNAEARDAALAAEQKEDPDAFSKRMDQNGRNLTMEEDCLKDGTADSEWFKSQVRGEGMWKGNEDVYDALAATLEIPAGETPPAAPTNNPADAANTPPEATDTPADATEKKEEDPEIADLKKQIAELKKAIDALTARLDKVEGGTKTEDAKEEAEKDEGTKDDAESDESTKEDAELSSAERAEKNKKDTDDTLDELDGVTDEETGKEAEASDEATGESTVEKVKEAKESDETDTELRSRLMADVRGSEPPKTVDEVKTAKEEAFDKTKEASDKKIDTAEEDERTQSAKVDGISQEIADLKQERSNAKKTERGPIDAKIQDAEARLATEKANLQTMEKNRETLVKNQETARDQMDREVAMLDTLEADWEKTAERTDKKLDAMGDTIIDLGDGELGSAVSGISVKHDGSLGLTMTGSVDAVAALLDGAVDAKQLDAMKATDNPAPTLRAVAAKIAAMEADKKKKT
ncbi:MAG: hypothetical protein KBA40_01095 [Candidatus Peribacteraceae bacterium]|nr:hypothetical protein [Candidatus Peribacteraceae bacterium]